MVVSNYTLTHSVFILLCIGCVHNGTRKLKYSNDDISDPNSAIYLDSFQLLTKYSYLPQKHSVTTEDGYIVNLFRIPRGGPPVLLVHGIGDSSDSWLVLGPTNSIACQLADAGFDVWLFNSRGNKYSNGRSSNLSDKQYWNFSYEEMGSQDLPATIDYILDATSQMKLSYIGFSQGTTTFIVMCSMRPEYNEKIKHAVLMAPVAWVSKIKQPYIEVLTKNLKQLTILAESLGVYELFPPNPLQILYHAKVCNDLHPARILCDLEYYISYGLRDIHNLSKDKLPVIASHIPAGSSTKTFVHFMQGYSSKKFQRYDYGLVKNQMVYGSSHPTDYNVSSVRAPVTLVFSESDWYSTIEDVQTLRKKLPNVVNYIVLNKSLDFTHLEFVYGARVKTLINDPVVKLISGAE